MMRPGPIDHQRVLAAAAELRQASADGRLDALCENHGVAVLTIHGSVTRRDPEPNDLDIAVLFNDPQPDIVGLLLALEDLVDGGDLVDVMNLGRAGVVARARGLAHGAEPLYESRPGAFAEAQMAALALEMEFAPLRREQLRVMAGR